MRQSALIERGQVYLAAAALAAHASNIETGFRQRDLMFLLQLFLNWTEHSLGSPSLELSNTHILRFLDSLVTEGYATKKAKGKQPHYFLSRPGLIELVYRVTAEAKQPSAAEFFFRCYFIKSYSQRVMELVTAEGRLFPAAIRVELLALLDVKELLRREIRRVEVQIRKLQERLQSCVDAANLAKRRYAQGVGQREIAQEVSEKYPYELNSRKPMSELYLELPPHLAQWELVDGHLMRASEIWTPSLELLNTYLKSLRALADGK